MIKIKLNSAFMKNYKFGFDFWGVGLFVVIMLPNILWLFWQVGWAFYYCGAADIIIIFGLIISPSVAFLIFAIDRKNTFAAAFALIFFVCHFISGVINFT